MLAAAATFSPVDSIWVFSARRRFAEKDPDYGVGFPWISLDSLVRIETYQWVTRDKSRRIFPPAFVVAKDPLKRQPTIFQAEGTDCSWGKLNLISDFLQYLSAQAVPFWPPPSKSNLLWAGERGGDPGAVGRRRSSIDHQGRVWVSPERLAAPRVWCPAFACLTAARAPRECPARPVRQASVPKQPSAPPKMSAKAIRPKKEFSLALRIPPSGPRRAQATRPLRNASTVCITPRSSARPFRRPMNE
jgi:hypothetical protein